MSGAAIDARAFRTAFERFQSLITAESGHHFRTFQDGLAAVWESYKPRLRAHALRLLDTSKWSEVEIGSGAIVNRTVAAIEIKDAHANLTNNLVLWQNRYGHESCDHRSLLEAVSNPKLCREIENLLFGLYCGNADEADIFDRLRNLASGKYPLLGYLFFLKDMDRFMPIQPTGFDSAFRALHIDFATLRRCNWENYATYNATLDGLRALIGKVAGLGNVRLVDAHSFCWIFSTLLKREAEGTLSKQASGKDSGRVLGGREVSIYMMRTAVENTVRNANGQLAARTVKNKELRMTSPELEQLIAFLLDRQGDRCKLTGIPFQFAGSDIDRNLLPSVDRIDSSGHYEVGNLQIVCQFVNFWKGDGDNEDFKRLLMLVRGIKAEE